MAYAIVRTDLMSGTKQPADLVSIKYQVSSVDTAIENGNVALVGALGTGEREVYLASAPAVDSALEGVVLVATPELNYDERLKNLNQFKNEAGEIARGYRLRSGNVFSVTAEALTATTPAVGNIVELQADTKLKVVSSLTSGSTKVGTVIAIEGDYIVIRVA
jgi:hypothetical protein